SFFEIDGVECGAEAGPMVAGATEIMEAGGFERVIFLAGGLTGVEVLYLVVILEATAFEEYDLVWGIVKFHRDADPGGAGTYDTDIAFDVGIIGKVASVEVHKGSGYGFCNES